MRKTSESVKRILIILLFFFLNIKSFSQDNRILNDINNIELGIIDIREISNIESIDRLFLSNSMLINFDYIINAENLEYLYINNCKFDFPIDCISELKNLKRLNITFCNIDDISFLGHMKTLEIIFLDNNKINDISIFEKLSNLQVLSLMYNEVTDITPLKQLEKLLYLNLKHNNILDFSPIDNLNNITNLRKD